MATRTLLALESRILQAALASLLRRGGDIEVVGTASTLDQAADLARREAPALIIIDEWLPPASLPTLARTLLASASQASLLALLRTSFAPIQDALAVGVRGFLDAESQPAELFEAIQALGQGKLHLSSEAARRIAESFARPEQPTSDLRSLTARELEVMRLVAQALSTKEVAIKLGISTRTAESHRAAVMAKLGLHKVSELVRIAIREGLIAP